MVLAGFHSQSLTQCENYTITHEPQTKKYSVCNNRGVIAEYASIGDLLTGLEWILVKQAVAQSSSPIIHAAAITSDSYTLLLPGASGAGKTTLALALVLNGWKLLSDELVPIKPAAGTLTPFPRVLCIKNKTLNHLAPIDPRNLLQAPDTVMPINDVLAVSPSHLPCACPDNDYPITHIAFPNHTPGKPPSLRPLSKSETLKKLTACIANRNLLTQRDFDHLAAIIKRIPCFELQTGDLKQTLKVLQTL